MTHITSERRTLFITPILLFVAVFIFLFSGVLFHGDLFGYRDAGYFYRPLCEQVETAFQENRIPLWDPYENIGEPLAANPASAVFYPIRFFLFAGTRFGFSFDICWTCYILLHVILAFTGFYLLTRQRSAFGVPLISRSGSLAASLAWTFSGPILFQVSNLPFLIGAAWLPFLLAAETELIRRPRFRAALCVSVFFFLMVTGGEPQSAFLGLLLFIPLCLTVSGEENAKLAVSKRNKPKRTRTRRNALIYFAVSILFGLGLSAVQILPTIEMTVHSDRAIKNEENELAEAAKQEHRRSVYSFSTPPWRGAEFLWPGIGGEEFPVNSRWFTALPNDKQVWTPSLYMGLYPFLAALYAFCFTSGKVNSRLKRESGRLAVFLSWLALLSFMAAWGGFGLGWLKRILCSAGTANWNFQNGDSAGGVYWLMTRLIPGWSAFRYPSKMMTFAALGFAFLAGIGWDRFWNESKLKKPFRTALYVLLAVSLAGFTTALLGGPVKAMIRAGIDLTRSRTIYGPCSSKLVNLSVGRAFAHTFALTLILTAVLYVKEKTRLRRNRLGFVVLILIAADLAVSQKWLTGTVPRSAFQGKSPMAEKLFAETGTRVPPRLFRESFLYPAEFLKTRNPNRLAERVKWDRATLFQKNAAAEGIANIDVRGTFVPGEYVMVSHYLRSELNRWSRSGKRGKGIDRLLASLGTDALFVSVPPSSRKPPEILFQKVANGGKRVRVVHQDRFRDWRDLVRCDIASEQLAGEHAEITLYRPERIEIDTLLQEPGKLFVADQFYPGWRASYRPKDGGKPTRVTVERTASIFRGIQLPAGQWHVVLEYKPMSFRLGVLISLVTFCFAAALAAVRKRTKSA